MYKVIFRNEQVIITDTNDQPRHDDVVLGDFKTYTQVETFASAMTDYDAEHTWSASSVKTQRNFMGSYSAHEIPIEIWKRQNTPYVGRKSMVYGKAYRAKVVDPVQDDPLSYVARKQVTFVYHDPDSLSQKQIETVKKFTRRLSGISAQNEDAWRLFAPYIDVIFMYLRDEITKEGFEKITGCHYCIRMFEQHNP